MNFEKYKSIMDIQYTLLEGLAFSNKICKDEYYICQSDIVADNYCNFAVLNNEYTFDNKSALTYIENGFKTINRKPCMYLPIFIDRYEEYKNILINNGYKINDTDVCMLLTNPTDTFAASDTINIKKVNSNEQYDDFMEVLESAYSGEVSKDNPYAGSITDEYHEAIRLSLVNDKFNHFVLYKDGIPASVATLSYKNGYGVLSNVGTKKEFQNLGLGKQMMNHCTNKFNNLGGNSLFLITELDSKNDRWYQKLGFEPIFVNEQYIKN